uniref:TIR domain-containing protein n=1 Tax=Salix viminalis TaxID=40686 RepID=A0A6N2LN97_SALVM
MMMDEFDQRLSSVLQLFSLHAVRRKPCKDYEELQKRERGCGSELVMLDMQGSKVQKLWKGTKGTNVVEGLALDVQGSFNTKSFTKMRRLQLLQITGAHLAGSYSLLPRELIWLCWPECPLKSLPSDFHLSELVILDMQKSKVRKLWKGTKSPFSSMSSSYRHRWNYDVFLSFRGEDTRKTITDHLYSALIQAGIHTFRDDNELPRGEEISPQLLRAIEGSRISVVVFSTNYASSRWCLDELVKIIECRQKTHQVVLPIFYDTDPSDVRKQTGSYAKAFDEHEEHFKEEMEKVNRWREALAQAGNLSGWGLNNEANGYEAKLIKTVVNNVACKLGNKTLHVAKHPVGISSRVQRVISLLRGARNNVGIVGIYGIAGIGKTTIAKAVFNNLYCRFEGSSFLSGVREISDKPNGLVELQERLVNDILKPNVWKISNVYEGMNLIKERLHRKNVLVVLDDVDKREQVEALMGERCWFGDGSILIIVTKNKHLLTEVEVDGMYHAKALDQDQSLQLFSLHAFRETRPAKDYEVLSGMVVDYCKGLPLALKILGSHLVGQDKAGWEINIAHWRNIPHDDIQAKLRVSFDALDVDSREIFLDIACFFVGKDKDYVADIVGERYDCHPEVAFRALIGRSLIAINNSLWMHDIVREMGREIIRQRSRNNPGNCSRIVLPKDAHIVLSKEMGTEAVEGLALDIQGSFSTKSFTKMRHLKLLQITGAVHLVGSYSLLPRELIWLYWPKCPLKSLPSDFHLSELVMLDMQGSKVQKLWKGTKPCFVEFGGLQQLKESSRKHGQLKISSNSQRY